MAQRVLTFSNPERGGPLINKLSGQSLLRYDKFLIGFSLELTYLNGEKARFSFEKGC